MKVIMVSRFFPQTHPRKGEPTGFVEKILRTVPLPAYWANFHEWNASKPMNLLRAFQESINHEIIDRKPHTIRGGNRFKAGDMASLRVWSDKPYRSKQIEFVQVEVKRVYPVDIYFTGGEMRVMIDGNIYNNRDILAKNDGLELADFIGWFQKPMDGQLIIWGNATY